MERQTLPYDKWFLDRKRNINEEEKRKSSAVTSRISIVNFSHDASTHHTELHVCTFRLTGGVKVLIVHYTR